MCQELYGAGEEGAAHAVDGVAPAGAGSEARGCGDGARGKLTGSTDDHDTEPDTDPEDMDAEATQPASGGGAALAQGHGRATLRRSSTKGIAEQMSASMGWLMEVLDGQRAKLAAQQEGLTGLQGELHAQEAALLNKHKQVRMLARASPPWVHG